MNKTILFLIILALFGCKNFTKKNKPELFDFYDLKEKKLINKEFKKPISELKFPTLRIWKFLGGGAVFGQVLEFKESSSSLVFYSYLLDDFKEKNEFIHLNFSKKILEKVFIKEIKSIISDPNFINSEDSRNYCKPIIGCSDTHIIEYKNGDTLLKFFIDDNIQECDNKKAIISKKLFKIMTQITQKFEKNINFTN